MKFSVLMSIYHKEQPGYFSQAMESLQQQTVPADQIVLVKDGPLSDELESLVQAWKARLGEKLEIVGLEKNQGLAAALNEGLKYCRYDFVARMDTDDIAKPERFAKQLQYLKQHPEVSLLSCWVNEVDASGKQVIAQRQMPIGTQEIRRYLKRRCPYIHAAVIYSKHAVMAVGGYQADCSGIEDYVLAARMVAAGYELANLSEYLLDVRSGAGFYARRGGWSYIAHDIKLQNALLSLKLINTWEYLLNLVIRIPFRLVPNSLRRFLYLKLLREKTSK